MRKTVFPALTLTFTLTVLWATPLKAANSSGGDSNDPGWVKKSDRYTLETIDIIAQGKPEYWSRVGIEKFDDKVIDLKPGFRERNRAHVETALARAISIGKSETNPFVRQDLDILADALRDEMEDARLRDKYRLPYFNLPQLVYYSLNNILKKQVARERKPAALVRLRRYVGLEDGYSPITELNQAFLDEKLQDPSLIGPLLKQFEEDQGMSAYMIEGIERLFIENGISGYEEALNAFKRQVASHQNYLKENILARCRSDFRLPPEIYSHNLKSYGVDMPVESLVLRARAEFKEIQLEMDAIAVQLVVSRGYETSNYREIIRKLKKKRIPNNKLIARYKQRIREIESLARRHSFISIPERGFVVRLASKAESAALPAPHMSPPRLIGNTGEMGEFVIPLNIPALPGKESLNFDDFSFDAATWTLAAHEARPGHEMQFAALVENGISLARASFAFNSVNTEGWALYAEAITKPYMPLEGQLISLQFRLLRAARAYLDPGLQFGDITYEQAQYILRHEVVLSEAMTKQELDRYTFRAPGQATSYFCGYLRLLELRADVERIQQNRFNEREFHDFILAQGLLPPKLLRDAAMKVFR